VKEVIRFSLPLPRITHEESADSLAAEHRAATVRERIGWQSYILWYSHVAIRSLTVAAPLALRT